MIEFCDEHSGRHVDVHVVYYPKSHLAGSGCPVCVRINELQEERDEMEKERDAAIERAGAAEAERGEEP